MCCYQLCLAATARLEVPYREAQAKFEHAIELLGTSAPLLYSVALCNYKLNKPGEALKFLARVVEMVRSCARPSPAGCIATPADCSAVQCIAVLSLLVYGAPS